MAWSLEKMMMTAMTVMWMRIELRLFRRYRVGVRTTGFEPCVVHWQASLWLMASRARIGFAGCIAHRCTARDSLPFQEYHRHIVRGA